MNFKEVNNKITSLIKESTASEQEKRKLRQLRTFVDSSIESILKTSFDSDAERFGQLFTCLMQVRDFLVAENVEDSLKNNLLKAFKVIEEQESAGQEVVKSETPQDNKKKELDLNLLGQ